MNTASLCDFYLSEFPATLRKRGDAYFREGRVELRPTVSHLDEGLVYARVRGSILYEVEIGLPEFDGPYADEGSIFCSCPHFFDHAVCKHVWAALRAIDQAHGNPETDSHRPTWESKLRAIESRLNLRSSYTPERPGQAETADHEIRFVINLNGNRYSSGLSVVPTVRRRRKAGDWGQWKEFTLREQPPGISQEEFLLANAIHGIYTRAISYGPGSLNRDQGAGLLPRLCATGKLFCTRNDETYGPLEWDDGKPLEFVLGLLQDPGTQTYRLAPRLVRDAEKLRLTDALAILDHWIITGLRVVPIQCSPSALSWLQTLRAREIEDGDDAAIDVPETDLPLFVGRILSRPDLPRIQLPDHLDFIKNAPAPRPHLALGKPRPRSQNPKATPARLMMLYGEVELPALPAAASYSDPQTGTVWLRDGEAESRFRDRLFELGAKPPPSYDFDDFDLIFAEKFLGTAVQTLIAEGWQVTAEKNLYRQATDFSVSVSSGIDWFDLEARCDFDGVQASLPALLDAARKKQHWVTLSDGSFGMLPAEWLAKWGALASLGEPDKDRLRFTRAQAGLLDAWLLSQDSVNVDEAFAQARQELQNFSSVAPSPPPQGFQGSLRPYQQEGLGWLYFLQTFGLGGCLADDMGLGKTVQVLALLESRREQRETGKLPPSLVVAPRSLIFNWLREAAQFTPELRIANYTGNNRSLPKGWASYTDVLLTTYGTLRQDIGQLKDIPFDYAILDESQAIKNAGAATSKSSRLIKARHRLAMSGTPVENHLGELWTLMDFLNPGLLGKASRFGDNWGKNPDPEQRAVLARALRPFILRRTKAQVAKDLPERQEDTLYCELPPKHRKHYDRIRDYYRQSLLAKVDSSGLGRNKIQVLEALLRLRQAACHPALLDDTLAKAESAKLDTLLPRLEELIEEGHKALVFSQFTSFLAILRQHLDKLGIRYEYLDGQTRDRQACVDRFQESPDLPLFLISLKAGGLGLNLTAADYVFLLDPWWNPAVEAQAIDRAHRIGQVRTVMAYRLIAADTVEEKVLELQRQKKDLADAILSEDKSLIRNLTREDLELLLS